MEDAKIVDTLFQELYLYSFLKPLNLRKININNRTTNIVETTDSYNINHIVEYDAWDYSIQKNINITAEYILRVKKNGEVSFELVKQETK